MTDQKTHSGKCFRGAVEIEVSREPVAMGYCHCDSCREWSAGPINAFTLWPPDEHLGGYQKSDTSLRKFCKVCGHVLTEHPLWGVTDVYAAVIPGFRYVPALHVNYETTVLHIRDGPPKYKDMPSEMGGSGTLLDE